jgi:TRAP-type mannitol/chloroaromatic compound transport system permease large subunit
VTPNELITGRLSSIEDRIAAELPGPDDTAMLIIVAPLYVPLIISLGFNPIWYGILYTITCQIAYITPPFGYNLFLMRAMAPTRLELAGAG